MSDIQYDECDWRMEHGGELVLSKNDEDIVVLRLSPEQQMAMATVLTAAAMRQIYPPRPADTSAA